MKLPTWLNTSLDLNATNNMGIDVNSTLRLFDDSPVKKEATMTGDPQGDALLAEELKRVSAENKMLEEMLAMVGDKYNALRTQMVDYMANNTSTLPPNSNICFEIRNNCTSSSGSKKRNNNNNNNNKMIGGAGERSSSDEEDDSCSKKHKGEAPSSVTMISKAYVKTEASDTSLIVKDGYQWRKYGQKVTRDNPSPRAYFRCSFAPRCFVKKKVQRSVEDQSILVAIYEGEHNHPPPSQPIESTSAAATRTHQCTVSTGPATVTLDLTKPDPMPVTNPTIVDRNSKTPEFQKLVVEEMASSLAKDPSFTAALAAAMSARFVQEHNSKGK